MKLFSPGFLIILILEALERYREIIGCAYPRLTSVDILLESENITREVSLRESKKVISV